MRSGVPLSISERTVTLSALAAIAAAAWVLLGTGDGVTQQRGLGEPGFLAAFAMWLAMMVAMMLPAVTPWVLVLSHGESRDVVQFLAGYFAIWGGYAVLATLVQVALQEWGMLHSDAGKLNALAGGIVLAGAGLFQFTSLKTTCLRKCRSPLAVFLRSWPDGPPHNAVLGARHALFCVGCCWALMAVVFALGVMSLFWMAAIAAVVCLERLAPKGFAIARVAGVVMTAAGGWMIAVWFAVAGS